MSAQRPGTGGPSEEGEGPEFGWLYGRGSAQDVPEATQRIPVQPRPGGSPADPTRVHRTVAPAPPAPVPPPPSQPPRPAPTPGPAPTPSRTGGGGFWSRRLRRPGFYVRAVLLLVLLWVVYLVAVPFVTWSSSDQVAFEPKGARPAEQDGTTYLLVGSDSRAGLSAEDRKRLTTGNATSELTDTIMLMHTGSGPNVLLSIPRDTATDSSQYGVSKINAAYARGGVPLLTRIVEDMTGVRVDHYVEIGLGGVADVVDAVGGIEVCPRERMQDPFAGLDIKKGCQEVDGTVALAYSRSRKFSTLGDLDRVRRQREVVAAIGDRVLSPWTAINPVRWWRLNQAVPRFFVFGEGTSKLEAGRWALGMSRVQLTCTMPVTDLTATTWDLDRAGPLLDDIIEDRTDDISQQQCTGTGAPR